MYRDVALSAVTCDTSYRLRMTGTARFLIHGCLRRLVVVCFDFISFPHECRFVHHVCILFFWHAALGAYCTFSAIAPFVLFDLVGSLVTSVSHCSWYYCRLTRRVALLLWLLYLCRISSRFVVLLLCLHVCTPCILHVEVIPCCLLRVVYWSSGYFVLRTDSTAYLVSSNCRLPGPVPGTTFLYQVQYKLPSTSIPTICTVVLRRLHARATDLPSYSFAAFFGLCIITLICIWFASTRLPECILAVH
jgi:hypothetical protein